MFWVFYFWVLYLRISDLIIFVISVMSYLYELSIDDTVICFQTNDLDQ